MVHVPEDLVSVHQEIVFHYVFHIDRYHNKHRLVNLAIVLKTYHLDLIAIANLKLWKKKFNQFIFTRKKTNTIKIIIPKLIIGS